MIMQHPPLKVNREQKHLLKRKIILNQTHMIL